MAQSSQWPKLPLTTDQQQLAADVTAGNNNWERAYCLAGNDAHIHEDMLKTALDLVVANFPPCKSLARVKRSMRWDMRKPVEMKVRQHVQNLIRLNNEESPNLPPFGTNQKLSEDRNLDIMLFGTPRSWQNEVEQQGFDPMEHSLVEAVDFMENIKSVEPTPAKQEPKKKEKKAKTSNEEEHKPPHCCKMHGANWTHGFRQGPSLT